MLETAIAVVSGAISWESDRTLVLKSCFPASQSQTKMYSSPPPETRMSWLLGGMTMSLMNSLCPKQKFSIMCA